MNFSDEQLRILQEAVMDLLEVNWWPGTKALRYNKILEIVESIAAEMQRRGME